MTADQVIQTSAASLRAAGGSFNGVVYTFSGAPDITGVTALTWQLLLLRVGNAGGGLTRDEALREGRRY